MAPGVKEHIERFDEKCRSGAKRQKNRSRSGRRNENSNCILFNVRKYKESFITVEGLLTLFVRISKIVSKIISKMETTE